MMQSSLDLAGNSNSESAPSSRSSQYSSVNSFLQAYRANLASKGEETISSPKTGSAQIQNLTDSTSVAAPAELPISVQHDGTAWLEPIISKASRKYGVDVSLIRAVIKAESNFNPQAVSRVGATGLMQLMPATARSLGVSDSFDPEQNVMAGTRFLKDLLQRYGGDVDSALAAYNWGPGNVDRRPEHLPRETRDYLARVKQLYASYNG
jgi:soluble lytic murein transglycosylase-like protein